jgi:hypothetical protein
MADRDATVRWRPAVARSTKAPNRGVRVPADGLVRDSEERQAETPYHAMTTEEFRQVLDLKRITADTELWVRLTGVRPTGNPVTIL